MANVQFGTNTPSIRKMRVYYEGTDTIYEGMGLCYNYDTTTNMLGWDNDASQARGTTTDDGYLNEGKFLRVEKPTTTNAPFFAGVVCAGGYCGKAGPKWVDIFEPNGAIVPVYTDKSITALDKVYIENAQYTLINSGTWQIGTFMETIDRSGTAGLVLARVTMPEEVPTTVAVAAATGPSAAIWNDIPVSELKSNFSAGVLYENDFVGTENLVTAEGWVVTQVTSGAISLLAAEGGALHVDSGGNASSDDGVNAQLLNCRVLPKAGNTIAFEARVKMNDATDQYFVGLAATDTTLIASGVLDDASDKCGFFHHAASTDNKISTVTARTSAEDTTADVAANVDATYTTLGFVIDGLTSVKFYVNGELVETGTTAANIPNAAMCFSVCAQVEATGADAEMDIDWVRIAQYGART